MIIYFFYICAGILTGLLAGLFGIGGGIVIIPTLVFIFKYLNIFPNDFIMPIATATSLAAIVFTSASSAFSYNKKKLINWNVCKKFMPGIIFGIIIGKYLAALLSSENLIKIFAIFLLFVAVQLFFKEKIYTANNPSIVNKNLLQMVIIIILSILVGISAIFFGVGGGILMVPTYLFLGLNIREASATSAACGVPIALIGTLTYIFLNTKSFANPALIGYVYWPAAISISVFSVIVAPIGVKIALKFPEPFLRKIFAVVLICISVNLI